MPVAQVTVDFVNEPKPGKKYGSIKTKELSYIGVKPEHLPLFTKGGSYQIEYVEKGDFKDFIRVVGKANGTPANGAPNPEQSRFIFITGIVGRAMGSGQFKPGDITNLTRCAADAWDDLAKSTRAQVQDEVPY